MRFLSEYKTSSVCSKDIDENLFIAADRYNQSENITLRRKSEDEHEKKICFYGCIGAVLPDNL